MKVSLDDIRNAEKAIRSFILHTPLEHSGSASLMATSDIFIKLENFQLTGSFKIRGAANKLLSLSSEEKKRGVVAASAGNHAQGVACMAKKLGIKATIVMPESSPLIKIVSTKRFGAEVVLKGSVYDESYEHARQLQEKQGYVFIHPFEDEKIIAGQGTLGLEVIGDCPEADAIFIPVGGGGLLSGIATAVKAIKPHVKIVGVQAQGADSMARSFWEHKLSPTPAQVSTIADGIAVKKPSKAMYQDFIAPLCDEFVTVSDDEIARAIVFLMERTKTVAEGAGAAALAAVFSKRTKLTFSHAVAIVSGGNIDLNIVERVIDRGMQAAGRLVKINVAGPDIPGTLNKITSLIASERANILQINHSRVDRHLGLRETLIEFTLETTGTEQIQSLVQKMNSLGLTVRDVE